MPPQVDCSATLLAFFQPAIYNFVGSSTVLPELLQSLDQSALSAVQFLQNGAVRITFHTRPECERVPSAGIQQPPPCGECECPQSHHLPARLPN